ncbi:MAG: hypothetical protein IJ660_05560 [Alphaproteobacteria bacterium]|nr:hypothetical protein [Alphaproteobacteria bacterium]
MAKKEKSLAELSVLREQGVVTASDEEIAKIRAQRAGEKAKRTSREEVRQFFPSYEAHVTKFGKSYSRNYDETKEYLRYLAAEIRAFRKDNVEKGKKKEALKEQLKIPYHLAFTRLAPTYKEYNEYRNELGDLLIEGLKIQDRELKVFTYNYVDKLLTDGFVDWGWFTRMLAKNYVSRYGWALLRKHSDLLGQFGGDILGPQLDEWANGEKFPCDESVPEDVREENRRKNAELKEITWANWTRLSSEDGKPADMREILPRHVGCS